MKEFDTICAVATPMGEGGVAIIRISGENALNIASKIFISKNNYDVNNMQTYTMKYGNIIDVKSKEIIDEVILSYMKAPSSYTAHIVSNSFIYFPPLQRRFFPLLISFSN